MLSCSSTVKLNFLVLNKWMSLLFKKKITISETHDKVTPLSPQPTVSQETPPRLYSSCNYCALCSSFVLAVCLRILLILLPIPADTGSFFAQRLLLLFSKCHFLFWGGCSTTEVTAENIPGDSQGCSLHGRDENWMSGHHEATFYMSGVSCTGDTG